MSSVTSVLLFILLLSISLKKHLSVSWGGGGGCLLRQSAQEQIVIDGWLNLCFGGVDRQCVFNSAGSCASV